MWPQTHVAPVSPRTERATSGLGLRDKPSSDKALKIGRKQAAATKLQQKQTTTKAEGLNRPKNKRNETSKTTVSETVATTSPDESNDEVVYMATYNPHSPTRQWDINDDSSSGGSSPPPASYSDENDLSSEDAALQGAIYESTQAASPPRAAKNPPHNWLRTASLQDVSTLLV
ncbi:expressed unknown protein [Seminavis robusta]|uniref:Uncharacterized protein n=1 Tax=Seminavis robusta TaxID=568900 RepID=A0A9N8HVY0_9STRA|nr:expressed unknown protein [Seminavis robusta]|eukprot:Sro2456_g328230.1 n/a (173) ;mRNA; f:12513-13031